MGLILDARSSTYFFLESDGQAVMAVLGAVSSQPGSMAILLAREGTHMGIVQMMTPAIESSTETKTCGVPFTGFTCGLL
jgi:hypothetical protein